MNVPPSNRRYRQAAVAYLVYGVVYLAGAVYLAEAGFATRGSGSGWIWFVVGLAFLVVIPAVIWRGVQWFTLLIAALMAIRVAGLVRIMWVDWRVPAPLPGGGQIPLGVGALVFAMITLVAMGLLIRAAWPIRQPTPTSHQNQ